jgi:hypothetical protein
VHFAVSTSLDSVPGARLTSITGPPSYESLTGPPSPPPSSTSAAAVAAGLAGLQTTKPTVRYGSELAAFSSVFEHVTRVAIGITNRCIGRQERSRLVTSRSPVRHGAPLEDLDVLAALQGDLHHDK